MISRLNFLAFLLLGASISSPSCAWTSTIKPTTRVARSPFQASLRLRYHHHHENAFTATSQTPRFIDVMEQRIPTGRHPFNHSKSKTRQREQRPQKQQGRRWLRSLAQCTGLFLVLASLVGSPAPAIASSTTASAAAADVGVATAAAAAAAITPPPLAPPPTAVMALPQSLPAAVPRMVELQLTLRLLFASLLGAAVGQERSSTHKHSAGVRTMALVALGACAFTVCSIFGFAAIGGGRCDPSRMASNVASGVGFVGAGVITTTSANPNDSRQSIVHGLTTATAIWISAAVGVACGVGMFYIASAATLSTISILRFGRVKKKFRRAAARKAVQTTTATTATTKPSDQDDVFYFTDPRPRTTPPTTNPTSPPPHDDHMYPLHSTSTTPTTTTTTSSTLLEETMEEDDDGDDEWDYIPESHESEEEDDDEEEEEDDQRIASQTTTTTTTNQIVEDNDSKVVVVEGEEILKEEINKSLDLDVAEFQLIGQATLLEQAHVASRSKNLTELVTNESKHHRLHTNHSEAAYVGASVCREGSINGGNETLSP